MRRTICLIGCIALLICLVVTIGLLIGAALCDYGSDALWRAGWIELCGMVIFAIGSGEFKD